MDMSIGTHRRAFSIWLRTGRWTSAQPEIEQKFNPYHDPRDGRFTFAPGGPRALEQVLVSDRRRNPTRSTVSGRASLQVLADVRPTHPATVPTPLRPADGTARFELAQFRPNPRAVRGGNIDAFRDPMTLERAFPALRDTPAGGIVGIADSLLDLAGPGARLTTAMSMDYSNTLIAQIRAIDPDYRIDSLGFPQTLDGQINQLNTLRFDRAAAFLRAKGEARPMQVETLRFIQSSTDRAYEEALTRLKAGTLTVRLSKEEAIGNYIDRQVRRDLRRNYNRYSIDSSGKGPVRVNRRENISTDNEATFRRPDARVDNIAYDVTLTQKTLKTAQVRGFFDADFAPSHVIIIRPTQIGHNNSYIITRPEPKR